MVIIADCLSVDGSSILPRIAKFLGDSYTGYYACLARRSKEFDSLILHQFFAGFV